MILTLSGVLALSRPEITFTFLIDKRATEL
jgi:hypothetical protein